MTYDVVTYYSIYDVCTRGGREPKKQMRSGRLRDILSYKSVAKYDNGEEGKKSKKFADVT